jgi:hypothetical protein
MLAKSRDSCNPMLVWYLHAHGSHDAQNDGAQVGAEPSHD